ncbi:unnamed protein product [Brachionus calyciflorus]|uniref:Mucoidy inhibitor A n=1 Tax=Brachionus calyciflorus TaxID=104777 RepID=A0A814JAJ3_9BILA|nr:unnamed protein product [Brachionus calyciflorus]
MSEILRQEFSVKNLECKEVVVYQDRAEVKRCLKTSLRKGENEIVLTHITPSIDNDSVRVDGKGNATVLDVICETKTIQIDKNETNERLQKSSLEIKNIENKIEETKFKLDRYNKKTQVLNEFATTLSKPTNTVSNNDQVELASSKQNIDNFLSFIDLYSTKLELFDTDKLTVQNLLNDLNEQLKIANENHRVLAYGSNYETKIEITILVQCNLEKSDIELDISYLVRNASWSPKYDIRVNGKERSMIINYFGLISQTTGEDWKDTKMYLSTAVPSIDGNVPVLGTQSVKFRSSYRPKSFKKMMMRSVRESKAELLCDSTLEDCQDEYSCFKQIEAEVNTSEIGSTSTFEIPRKSSIPSDGKTHKVSIAIIDLSPEFEYETVPRKNNHAYIKAKVKNISEYTLLSGPANVFLDNNFVSKTFLNSYSPQEELDLSLGVDPAIRIDYKPVKKYTTKSGLLSKTTSKMFIQVIEIKNTSMNKIKILLSDNLPLSTDEKIQVKLIEPDLKKHSNIRLNKSNNLEFDLEIEPSKKEEITIKYTIDSPSDKDIDFY